MREQVVFPDRVHFQVDPQVRVTHTEIVHKACGFNEILFLSECDQIHAKLAHKLFEGLLLEVFLLELAEISEEDIERDRDMFLVEASSEHFVHEVVDFVD